MPPCDNRDVKTLMVASAGGHLEELWLLQPRLSGTSEDRVWVTWDTPQSRSLLAGEQRIFIPHCRPRDARATLTNTRLAFHVLALGEWSDVISTGSLPAVPFMTLARTRGIPCHFIESAARVDAPSLTAKLLTRVPGVHCYSQHRWETRPAWQFRGSVFDSFTVEPCPTSEITRVVVTLGANQYGFRRLLEAVLKALPPGADVLWQTGATDVSGLPIEARPMVPEDELFHAMTKADVVVAHAGLGSAVTALRAGRCPVLVPRHRRHSEHVDDHQKEIARELGRRRLAVAGGVDTLTLGHLEAAAGRRVLPDHYAPPFVLEGTSDQALGVRPARLAEQSAA
jgi:UDP-N-acetylglucosamine--N-acetylmuramyl-(pentapeptide) pyrophosphoryl-undecaprenol N-acetylglucosamine transferase